MPTIIHPTQSERSKRTSDLIIKISIQEIVMRVGNAERRPQKRFGRWSLARITAHNQQTHSFHKDLTKADTHIVKQSYIKLSAAGPTTVLTSSGIGGAWFNDPSL